MEQTETQTFLDQTEPQPFVDEKPPVNTMEKIPTQTKEFIIPFNGMTPEELKQSNNKFLMNWEVLSPAINETVLLRKYEVIKGYIISERGIEIVVGFKDGRKRS